MVISSFGLRSSTFNGRLNCSVDLMAVVVVGEFGHALEHLCWWVGLHELHNGGYTDFMGVSGVLVYPVENGADEVGVSPGHFIERGDDGEPLEVRDLLFSFKVWFENGHDLGMSCVAKSAHVHLDLDGVAPLDGSLELFLEVWDVLLLDSFFVFALSTAEMETISVV